MTVKILHVWTQLKLHIVTIVYITLVKVYVVGHRATIMPFLVLHTGDTLIIKYDNLLV